MSIKLVDIVRPPGLTGFSMKISAKAEYACLAVIALARTTADRAPVRIRSIAEEHGIPERYLVQILLQLKGAGLVYSSRGAAGGYRLARPAEEISLRDVLSAIDGPGDPPREISVASARVLATVLEEVKAAEDAVLTGTSIAQLAERMTAADWTI